MTAAPSDSFRVTIKTSLATTLSPDEVVTVASRAMQDMATSGTREVVPTDVETITAVTDSFIQQEVPEAG